MAICEKCIKKSVCKLCDGSEIMGCIEFVSLNKGLEQEPVYYPPCIDCNKKMYEIRNAYDNMTKALEQEPFINKPCVSSGVCEHDKQKVLDKIRAEIEQIELLARYTRGDIKQMALDIIDKYKAEIEPQKSEEQE